MQAGGEGPDETTFSSLTTFTTTLGETGDGDGDSGDGDGDPGDGDGDGDPGEMCGNGVIEGAEECDDGNAVDSDACTSNCIIAACGDGNVYEGVEECDDGNPVEGDECTNACAAAVCGDGIVHEGVEMCDDGNDVDGDGCSTSCMAGSCGDGVPDPGELCDDGNADNTDACAGCQPASCGDGYVQAGVEACDDGNDLDTDACIACVPASCGDGHVQQGVEACDDGNDVDTDACPACQTASCGDGYVLQGQEECDDGNNVSNDGCSAQCDAEVHPQCLAPYNTFNDATRNINFNDAGQTVYCDNVNGNSPGWVGPGWYRFTGAAGVQMPEQAPGDYSCGTHAAGWLNGVHPQPNEGIVQRTVCFDWSPGPCWQQSQISVVNCGSYYLYNLVNPAGCSYRYCGRN